MTHESVLDVSKNIILALVVAALVTGCGGGSGSAASGSLYGAPAPAGPPQALPTPAASAALATLALKGAGFINAAGLTVYVFDADLASPGHSVCNGVCALNWPHVAPPAGKTIVAPFATITRDDGSKQLTYNGRPLYTFIADSSEGQTNGDGLDEFGGIWHIARPH